MTKYGTNFLETEAILAAQEGDEETLKRILDEMLPGELRSLATAADFLSGEAREARRAKLQKSVS